MRLDFARAPSSDTTSSSSLSRSSSEDHINLRRPNTFKDEFQPAAESSGGSSRSINIILWVSVVLHATFLLVHIALVTLLYRHPEHNLIVPLEQQGKAATLTTVVLQIIGLSWTTAMLLTTQQLVVRRDLDAPQTLTSTHDNDSAWSGLGSSLLTLWRQIEIPAHVSGTIIAVVYLGGMAALHVTTPSLFNIEAFNITGTELIGTRGGIDWQDPAALPSLLLNAQLSGGTMGFLDTLPDTRGLNGTVVYDVLDDNYGAGPVDVMAKNYDVDCSHLITSQPTPAGKGLLNFTIDGLSPEPVMFDFVVKNSIGFYGLGDFRSVQELKPYARLAYSPTPIVDSAGTQALRVSLDPPLYYSHTTDIYGDWVNVTISELYVVVCTLSVTNTTITVDAQSKTPEEGQQLNLSRAPEVFAPSRDLSAFRLDGDNTDLDLLWWRGSNIANDQQLSMRAYNMFYCGDFTKVDARCEEFWLNALQEFVMAELEMTPDIFNSSMLPNPESILLTQLQLSMSRAIAAQFWSSTHTLINNFERNLSLNQNLHDSWQGSRINLTEYNATYTEAPPVLRHQAKVSFSVRPAARLNLVSVPVFLGTAIAAILIGVLIPTWRSSYQQFSSAQAKELDSFGLLQVVWLIQKHPDVCGRIGDVGSPTLSNLRRAGLVRTQLMPPDLD